MILLQANSKGMIKSTAVLLIVLCISGSCFSFLQNPERVRMFREDHRLQARLKDEFNHRTSEREPLQISPSIRDVRADSRHSRIDARDIRTDFREIRTELMRQVDREERRTPMDRNREEREGRNFGREDGARYLNRQRERQTETLRENRRTRSENEANRRFERRTNRQQNFERTPQYSRELERSSSDRQIQRDSGVPRIISERNTDRNNNIERRVDPTERRESERDQRRDDQQNSRSERSRELNSRQTLAKNNRLERRVDHDERRSSTIRSDRERREQQDRARISRLSNSAEETRSDNGPLNISSFKNSHMLINTLQVILVITLIGSVLGNQSKANKWRPSNWPGLLLKEKIF